MLFAKFPNYWKLTDIKNLIFNTTTKLECFELWYFWLGREIKMPENVAISLNCKIKEPQNSKINKKPCKITTKVACLHVKQKVKNAQKRWNKANAREPEKIDQPAMFSTMFFVCLFQYVFFNQFRTLSVSDNLC